MHGGNGCKAVGSERFINLIRTDGCWFEETALRGQQEKLESLSHSPVTHLDRRIDKVQAVWSAAKGKVRITLEV